MSWIFAIIVGGLAGWIAEKIMKFDTGLMMNVVLGIVGALVVNFLLNLLGVPILGPGWLNYMIKGIIGACILIYGYRMIKQRG